MTITVSGVNYTIVPNPNAKGVIVTSKRNKFILKEEYPETDLDVKFLENAIYKFNNY